MLRLPLYPNEPGEIGFGAKLLEDGACGIEFQFRACPIALLTAGVQYLYSCFPTDVLRDGHGGVRIARRALDLLPPESAGRAQMERHLKRYEDGKK